MKETITYCDLCGKVVEFDKGFLQSGQTKQDSSVCDTTERHGLQTISLLPSFLLFADL